MTSAAEAEVRTLCPYHRIFHQTEGPQLIGKRIRSGDGAQFHPGGEEGAARFEDEGLGGPLR